MLTQPLQFCLSIIPINNQEFKSFFTLGLIGSCISVVYLSRYSWHGALEITR